MSHAVSKPVLAIDGPSGVGKSTVAKAVAKRLGIAYLDTGAMYRAATWWVLHTGVDIGDPAAITAAVASMPLRMEPSSAGPRVYVDGHDVSQAIRTPEITRHIHYIDQIPEVRQAMASQQRQIGSQHPSVVEGRDIGTVVFPDAACKVYLTASLDERARRRTKQLHEAGEPADYEATRHAIEERDRRAETREHAPLRQADDAIRVDATAMSFDETVARIATLASGLV